MIRSKLFKRLAFGLALAVAIPPAVGLAPGRVVRADGPRSVVRTAQRQPKLSLDGGVGWINTGGPIRLEDLRGKLVLLDFWTYCCINCHHVLPDLARLEAKYPNNLVVIGVHTAKFDAERDTENIRKKVREYRIEHPVVNDADQVIWNRFGVNAWPTLVLIDALGQPVGAVSGEGHYDVLDRVIGQLVARHKEKGELDETPLKFFPEKDRPSDGPLLFPGKVLADAKQKLLFISDTGHNRIVVTNLEGRGLATIGTGEVGLTDGAFDKATFNRPQGLCLVGETLYVADTENHALRAVDLRAKTVKTAAGTGAQSSMRKGKGPGPTTGMNSPWDVLRIPGTNLLAIAMAGPHQIWTYDLKSEELAVWAGSGMENIVDGSPDKAAFAQPSGLATDGASIFVADSEASGIRTVQVEPPHRVGRVVGVGLFDYGDIDGVGAEVRLQHCLGVAYADGTLYIADSYNNKIKACDPKERSVKTFVGDGQPGDADDPPRFDEPGGLSIAGGAMYVADTNNHRVRRVDLETKAVTTLDLEGVTAPVRTPRPPSFPNAVAIEAPAARVAPGKEFSIEVKLALPEGFKLSPEAPLEYLLRAPEAEGVLAESVSPAGATVAPPTVNFKVPVPLAAAAEAGSSLALKLSVASVICREGQGGVCIPRSFVWTIPVTFDGDGASTITVEAPLPKTGS